MGEAGYTMGGGLKQDQFFRRMQAVADLRYDDSADEAAYRAVLAGIDECDGAVLRYAQENGYVSDLVGESITNWSYELRCRLQAARARLEEGFATIPACSGSLRRAPQGGRGGGRCRQREERGHLRARHGDQRP